MLEIRPPTLEDKKAVLDVMREHAETNSSMMVDFGSQRILSMKIGWQENLDAEMGLNSPKTWMPTLQFVAFVMAKRLLVLTFACASMLIS